MILVIDNYDSFTWNLVQYLGELGADPLVRRNDSFDSVEIGRMSPNGIVISPGPGVPSEAGMTLGVIRDFAGSVPMLGVCLGHQAIAEAFGGKVVRAPRVMHGKTSQVAHAGTGLFAGIASPMEVMRYHSLTVEAASLPDELEVIARGVDDSDEIHGLRHRQHRLWGVQFHPESVMTPDGRQLIENFLQLAR